MKNYIMRPYTLLAAALFVLTGHTSYGQICPNKAQSQATIIATEEQCFEANDGKIEISFVNAAGIYDPTLGDFTPGTGDYEYNLFEIGNDWVYDESTLSIGSTIVPSIAVSYQAPNKITFTGLPSAGGYRIYLVGGDCDGSFNGREFNQSEAFGTPIPAAPEIIIDPDQIDTEDNTVCTLPTPFDGEINMNSAVSGGAGGYEYSIDGTTFQTSPVFPNLEHGTYTVTVIDQNSTTVGDNCTKTINVDVPDGRVPPAAAITPANPEACASVDLPLNGSPTGGTEPYASHTWTGDVGFLSATDVVNPTFNSAAPGTYNLTYEVTDDKGCTATSSVTITVVDPTVVSLIVDEDDPTICAGESTSVIVRSAQAGYRYQLRNDADDSPIGGPVEGPATALMLPTGNLTATTTFNVLVSSVSGPCPDVELTDQATVTVIDAVDLTLAVSAQDGTICSGDATSILLENSESGVAYQLRNDADDSNVGSTLTGNGGTLLFPVSPAATTIYNIVADNGVCTEAELDNQATVTVNPSPTQAVLSGDATVCAGSSTNLTVAITNGVGPFSFTIANSLDATTFSVTGYTSDDNILVTPTADVTYSISGVVTDANGCEVAGSGSATITIAPLPTANDQAPVVCEDSPGNGATVDLTSLEASIKSQPSHTVDWFEDAALTLAVATPTSVTVSDADDFFAQVSDGVCQSVATVTYTVNSTPDATFSYNSGTFCQDAGPQSPTVTTPGGSFTADPGLAIDATTGVIDIAASTALLNTPQTVTYSFGGTCPSSSTFEVTITNAPDAEFEYAPDQFCQDVGNQLPVFPTGGSGGTFTASPAGLDIDPGSGEIDPLTSTPGLYTVRNTIAANGTCAEVVYDSPVRILEQDDPSFSYAAAYCQDDTDPVATITVDAGNFTASPAGMVFLDATAGEIDLSASTAGITYTVTYTTTGTCFSTSSANVTINSASDPSFSYPSASYCPSEGTTAPNSVATPGGSFSSTAGLNFNDISTGEINLATSTPGSYTITYTLGGTCPSFATYDITINPTPIANDQAPVVCEDSPGNGATVDLTALESAINADPGITITWFEEASLTTAVATPASVTVNDTDDFFARVSDGICQSVATVVYTVNPLPTVADQTPTVCESAAGSGAATISLTVQQNAIDGGAGFTYAWFTDATLTTPVADPNNVTANNGDDFFARASDGSCEAVASVTFTVQPLPAPSFTGLASPYCLTDAAVTLTGSENPNGTFTGPGITDNGDGTAAFNPATAGEGTHSIIYSFTNGAGCASQAAQTVVVNDCTTPFTPNFTADITSVCEGETVRFTNQSSGAITIYDWDFGAGATPATATGVGPHIVTYGTAGNATVSLTVDGPTTVTKTNYITINAEDDAGFGYDASAYCPDGADPSPSFVNTPGGSFTATPAGLVIRANDGLIDLSASTAGVPYTITYATGGPCSSNSTFNLTIEDFDDASFSYLSNSYCQGDPNPAAIITGDPGGTFAAPAGLIIADDATGKIDLPGSTAGTYEVTYTTAGTCPISEVFEVTIIGSQTAAFNYASGTYCFDGADPAPEPGYATGGTFSTTDPIDVDPDDGTIDVSASTVGGPYTITYTIGSGSCVSTESFQVSIINSTPNPTFDYSQDQYCTQAGTTPPVFAPGATAGTFSYQSSPPGPNVLALGVDGSIDLASSDPGTYRVRNSIAGSGGSCASVTHEETVQIFAPDVADISYNGGNAICQSESTDPKPVFAAGSTTTGTFTVTSANAADITIVSTTGLIDLSDTDPGSYDIQFETNGPCRDIMTVTVEIEAATDASFDYSASSFCIGTGSVAPGAIATSPGVFSASSPDLLVNSADGEIDVNNSIPGSYYVIYETAVLGVCNGRDSVAIAINDITADAGADDLACRLRYDLTGNAPAAGATGEWLVATTPSGSETATFANRFSPTTSVSVSDSGRYEFEWRVTQGGCSVSDRVEIMLYDALQVIQIGYSEPVDCSAGGTGSTVMAAGGGSGSFTFSWSLGTGTPVNPASLPPGWQGESFNNVPPGTHTLTVTDNVSFCDTVVTFTMGVKAIDDDLTSSGTTICAGDSDGEITVTATDPADAREYTITYFDAGGNQIGSPAVLNPSINATVTVGGFSIGTYTLKVDVTDSSDPTEIGCSSPRKVKIAEHPAPVISLNTIGQPSCLGTTDRSITVDVSGTIPDSYAWTSTNGDTYNTQNLTNIPAGDYTLIATYNGTCTETFGPVSVLPQNTSDGPTAITPLAPSVQCSSFDARWSDEGVGVTYQLDVSQDASFTTPLFLTQGVAANTTTFTVGALAPGTPYFYRVRSVDGSCVSENSNVISVTTETGDVPSGLYATGASCDAFTAHWAPVTGATDYAVQVATDAAFTNVLVAYDSVAVGSNNNKLDIAGLTEGQTYHYRVTATTACGTSAYSAAATVTTDGLTGAPTALGATPGCTAAELSWQAVSGSVSRYEVYLDTDNDFTNGTLSASPDATEVTATTTTVNVPTPGDTYFFHVLAILNGCNTTMEVASFTARNEPSIPVIVPPTGDDVTCNAFTLSWSAVPDADDYVVDVSEDGFATFTTNNVTNLSLEVSGLTPGTPYQYRVKARGCTESAPTSGTVTTDDTPGGLANAPTAAAPSCVGFTVNWTAQPGIRYLVEASPVGDNFTSVIERSAEVNSDTYTFSTLAVETSYSYRVISVNDCGEGPPTIGSGTIATKLIDECGCGHDQVAFTVTTSNATCPGGADGAFTILSRKKSGVTVTPDMGRFKYRYQSLTNPADTSAWEAGEPGSPPLPHFFDSVKAGDYQVLVWDTLGLPGCVDTVAFTTTISLQNQVTVVTKAETCDTPGGLVVTIPAACIDPDRIYVGQAIGSTDTYPIDSISSNKLYFSGLVADDYQIVISDFIQTDIIYATLPATIPNNCSSGTDTTTVCNLNGITFIPETTLADCDTGEGSVTFTSVNNTVETFTFTVIEEGGVVFETKEGTSGITFDNLPSRRYTYEIYDALSQSCRGKFTVGTKSVNFTATVPQTIACTDVTTSINVTVDTDATLAAGPYEVFLMDQTDTLAQTSLPLGSVTTTFADVAVGGSYEVVIVAAAEDACVARRTVDATPPGTTALQFTYALDSTACFQTRGGGKVTVQNIVVADNTPFDAYLYRVDSGEEEEYASRKFSTIPQSFVFEDIANGQYQVHLVQAQSGCVNTVQEKRSATFTIDGPEQQLAASIRSFVEVTVNYPYGTIEIDSITGGGAPYEVRIAADPSGGSTNWAEVINGNPIVRPYRYEYLDQSVGTYFVEVRDRFGCVVQRQVEVGYTSELYIPNIFTPNSDGENDTFQILNLEDFGENAGVQLTITNRWGRQVYRAKNYTNAEAWDGGNLSDGVYFYHLILPDNTIHNGWIEIWRGRTP